MRISTNAIYQAGVRQVNTLQAQLSRTQQQLGSNKRMLSAADDPIASARALEVTQSQSINTQFVTNRDNARSSLSQLEVALSGTQSVIHDVQDIVVAAGNGALSASDRESYATELTGKLDDLIALANSGDGVGGYLFAGFKSNAAPFTKTPGGADYNGDDGVVQLQVATSRKVAVNATGASVFENVPTGNGSFVTAAGTANTGTGVVSPGVVSDATKITGHDYELKFAVSAAVPPVTTYTVLDKTSGLPVPPAPIPAVGQPFASGSPITVDGMTFDVKGAPADGDTFTTAPSTKQSLFTTVTNLIAALRAPMTSAADKTAYNNSMREAGVNLSAGLDQVLGVRSSVGANLKELDYLDTTGSDADIQYSATLSKLQDLDMVAAISQFTQQQGTLEAAQKTFKAVSGLSLFNYI